MPFIHKMESLAEMLDSPHSQKTSVQAVNFYKQQLASPELTLSGQLITQLKKEKCEYIDLMLDYAHRHKTALEGIQVDKPLDQDFAAQTDHSRQAQRKLEQGEQVNFEAFLKNYLNSGLN